MIPNYTPNIPFRLLLKQVFIRNARQNCIAWFREYTGKQHILLTNSCRSALYLSYKASQTQGRVLTTPLCCTSALDPILAAGNPIHFCDINPHTLLTNLTALQAAAHPDIRFIQAVHHGGVMLDMQEVMQIAGRHSIMVVEDCGQAFGTSSQGVRAGTLGDIACFSLIKNGYGIGGGVLATNDEALFLRAKSLQEQWQGNAPALIAFRVLRTLLENKKHLRLTHWVYKALMAFRPTDQNPYDPVASMKHAYRRPASLFFRLFMVQSKRFNTLHSKRQHHAHQLAEELSKQNLSSVYAAAPEGITSAWDKFFCILPASRIVEVAHKLNTSGIEARHLENRYGSLRQPRLDELASYAGSMGLDDCKNYFKVHDAVLHLPLHEKMRPGDFKKIADTLNAILNEKNTD